MIKFIVQFIIIFFLWWKNAKIKKQYLTPSSFLLGLYSVAAFFAPIAIILTNRTEPLSSYYWIPSILFALSVVAFLYPFYSFNETKIYAIRLPSIGILNIFSDIIIILSIISIIYYGSTVNMIFTLSSLGDAREMIYAGEEFVEAGFFNTIASVSASMYVYALMLFFVYTAIGGHKKRRLLLLLSSISEVIHVLCYVGRDGVVFWIFSFAMLFLLFRPFLNKENSRSIRRFFFIGVGCMLIPFMLISISRFDMSDAGTSGSLISYIGQSFINGPLYYGIENKPISGPTGFPLFWELTGLQSPKSLGMIQIGDWRSWDFSTFIVDFYKYFGSIGLVVVCCVMYLWFRSIFNNKSNKLFYNELFVYILYFQILSQGVFYFRQYTRGGNLFMVICIILYFCYNKSSKKGLIEIYKLD